MAGLKKNCQLIIHLLENGCLFVGGIADELLHQLQQGHGALNPWLQHSRWVPHLMSNGSCQGILQATISHQAAH